MAPISLIEVDHHLQDNSPATNYMKASLQTEDLVVFTDSQYRDTYRHTETIMSVLQQKWTPVVLESDEHKEHKTGIEHVLNKITNSAPPPHLFYKQKYFASGRKIATMFAHGQLEHAIGLEVALVH